MTSYFPKRNFMKKIEIIVIIGFVIYRLTSYFITLSHPDFKCDSSLESMIIRNSNYEYNGGLPTLKIIDENEINNICSEFQKMERGYFLTPNYSNGYLDIRLLSKNNELVTLYFTVRKGYVFGMQDGRYYKNDALAKYLIELLQIKDVYSNEKLFPSNP